jgi:predicted acyl esterase
MTSTGRTTNILAATPANAGTKPTTWPTYVMGSKALPENNREWSCYPASAEEVGVKTLPVGWKKDERRRAVVEEILFDQNVSIPMRDSIKLKADIFRSPKTEGGKEKVPTILMYGPYGKSGTGPQQVRSTREAVSRQSAVTYSPILIVFLLA